MREPTREQDAAAQDLALRFGEAQVDPPADNDPLSLVVVHCPDDSVFGESVFAILPDGGVLTP
jgi:hypothetical protein